MMAESNRWLGPDGETYIDDYINSADSIIVERQRTTQVLLDIFRYHFSSPRNLSILDVGCGTGYLTKELSTKFPENSFYLLDGSQTMLDRARSDLNGPRFNYICLSFEEYLSSTVDVPQYDFVCSANALHHLDYLEKQLMYQRIYRELKVGGLFLNFDVVQPESERSETWQFQMWIDWINRNMKSVGLDDEVGTHDSLPQTYKVKPENKPTRLSDQVMALKRIGFRDVDCFWKHGIFALFGGTKT